MKSRAFRRTMSALLWVRPATEIPAPDRCRAPGRVLVAHSPATAGYGGLGLGVPRPPWTEAIRAVSSPQTNAPAPRRSSTWNSTTDWNSAEGPAGWE